MQFCRREIITTDKCFPVKLGEVMNLVSFNVLSRTEKVHGKEWQKISHLYKS